MIFGTSSYAAAALGFTLLTALLSTSWRGRRPGAYLIAASSMTALWSALFALHSFVGSVPFVLLYLAEIARDAAWLLALIAVAGAAAPRFLVIAAYLLCGALLALPALMPFLARLAPEPVTSTLVLSRAALALSLVALILLEQIYRNSSAAARGSLKFFVIGVGALFAYDLFLYSQAELLKGLSPEVWHARGLLNALAVPLLAVAARRNPAWSLDIFVSRQMVFYTTTFIAVGVYLLVMALGGYYVREVGGSWGRVGQVVFLAGAALVLASLLASAALRRHAQVFISKHFYRNKYDYRIEWLRFIATLSSTQDSDVRRTAVQAMTQIFSSPGGIMFLLEETGRNFVPYAAWPMRTEAVPGIGRVPSSDDLPAFLKRTQWIVDTAEYRRAPDIYGNILLPAWLQANASLRIVSPLLQLDRLVGFVVLYDPPPPFELTYEDRDLMKTVGRHVATHIAQHDADRKLAESRQFEAYNRLTAFMMHDLKNAVAQLKLIVANSERHKRNPEFIDDAIGTITNTVDRMTRLIEQLRGSASPDRLAQVDLVDRAREAVARCGARRPQPALHADAAAIVAADGERLTAVIEHVIRNAQDATGEGGSVDLTITRTGTEVTLTVADTGAGMDTAFVRDRLFRPFDSTKGSKGMGIGAYQVREYISLLGGSVDVQSSPGQGTRFSISLPVLEPERTRAVLARVG